MTTKLSQDRKDLDKFTKYLVYKYVQIIVQSRLGEKVHTYSKSVSSGSDWFSLAIRDIPEVLSETKKVYASGALTGPDGGAICVEISLTTAEGESLTLESWSLSSCAVSSESSPLARPSAYTRMSLLLKSLLCTTRVTPAYRLSRAQGADSYVVCYRVHGGATETARLGETRRHVRIGYVPAAVVGGQVALAVTYRTEMLISPQRATVLGTAAQMGLWGVEFRHDHFQTDSGSEGGTGGSPHYMQHNYCTGRRKSLDREDSSLDATDNTRNTRRASLPQNCTRAPCEMREEVIHRKRLSSEGFNCILLDDDAWTPRRDTGVDLSRPRPGAFASVPSGRPDSGCIEDEDDDDMPFSCLLQDSDIPQVSPASNTNVTEAVTDAVADEMSRSTASDSGRSANSQASGPEDFVMVELKTPFAGREVSSDLGQFYRDCQMAPPLSMFSSDGVKADIADGVGGIEETLSEVCEQLAAFDTSARSFDDFVNSLRPSEDELLL